jgi:hypothetical protein
MSEEVLRRFLERVNGDAAYRESVQRDPGAAFAAIDLRPMEIIALGSGDEDALRRLAGADVSGFAAPGVGPGGGGVGWDPVSWLFDCPHTPYCFTPGSGKGCGRPTDVALCPEDPDGAHA